MSKVVASLLVVALVGVTSLAFACDLRCNLQDSPASASDSPCHSHESHPAAPKHSVHTRAVVKALGVLSVTGVAMEAMGDAPVLQETAVATPSNIFAATTGPIVLRI